MAVPACNLAAVHAREPRVDGLSAIQALNLGDGRPAVNLGADGVAGGRKGTGQSEELLARLLGRWMRSTCEIAVEPPFRGAPRSLPRGHTLIWRTVWIPGVLPPSQPPPQPARTNATATKLAACFISTKHISSRSGRRQ